MRRDRLLFALALMAVGAAFIALDLGRYLDLAYVKGAQDDFAAGYAARPLAVVAAYFVAYVAVTTLSLPGAAVLTLLAGAMFGLGVGAVVVSFASSVGATLAMLVARYLLRDAVAARLGARLADVDRGIERDGAFYLFSLRLVPVLPFFVINLLMGLTRMPAATFYGVSQAGMLPGTLVYVYAGTQLARVDSLSGIVSPGLAAAFTALAVFPLAARRIVAAVRARRVYARWAGQRPARYDRDMVVIGAGAAGLVTAYIAAAVKAKVTLVEGHAMGGDCLNTGCVPSKALIRTARLAREIRRSADYGIARADSTIDFAQVMERVSRVIHDIAPHDSVERYRRLGVDVQLGRATILDPWRVRVSSAAGDQVLSTRTIVIATGARPVVPPIPGLDRVGYLTSETLWALRELPPQLVVLGGGPIGCELAQCFARLGSTVTLVEMAPRLLVREDDEVSAHARQALEADGVTVRTGHRAVRCEGEGATAALVVEADGVEVRLAFDRLLCAVGRVARLHGFGLETLGIPTDRTVHTDEYLRTIYPNILAAGDVAGPYQFTHAAAHQAWYAAVNGLFGRLRLFKADYRVVPAATFIDPEVARVGLNEREATAQAVPYEVTRYGLDDLDRAIADGAAHGWVKVLTVPGKDTILGATIVGAHAGDLIAQFALAMRHRLGLNAILRTIYAYPTLAESAKFAAGEWKRAHQPRALLRWVERFHAWQRG